MATKLSELDKKFMKADRELVRATGLKIKDNPKKKTEKKKK
jgi:hypothetical protein